MAGIRRVSDLGTKLNYVGYFGEKLTADGSSGHSNIYARNASGTSRPSNATIEYAVRLYEGKLYYFNNLTFNMPSNANTDTTDWTAPSADSYKWSYVYIRPTDNKFYISNTKPSAGQNYKTIGGSAVIYLFPIYSDNSVMFRFHFTDNLYTIMDFGATQTLATYVMGIRLIQASPLTIGSYTGGTAVDCSVAVPTTASTINTRYYYSVNGRYDSGGAVKILHEPQMKDAQGSYKVLQTISHYEYFKTPTYSGAYFPVYNWYLDLNDISMKAYDITGVRTNWQIETGTQDNYTAYNWNMVSFRDGYIF